MVSDTYKDRDKDRMRKPKKKKKDPAYSPTSPILEVNTEEDEFIQHLEDEEGGD